jgi:hypothetical protein
MDRELRERERVPLDLEGPTATLVSWPHGIHTPTNRAARPILLAASSLSRDRMRQNETQKQTDRSGTTRHGSRELSTVLLLRIPGTAVGGTLLGFYAGLLKKVPLLRASPTGTHFNVRKCSRVSVCVGSNGRNWLRVRVRRGGSSGATYFFSRIFIFL